MMLRSFTLLALEISALAAAPLDLRLPTANHHLLTNEPEKFYMYVERTFEGEISKCWEAGGYGFVRSPIRVNGQVVYTHFHEGIDISPMERDRLGNPLDEVTSIADGTVVHTSPLAGRSNYGKYVVVEHRWDDSSVYSLYAHLAEITCKPGDVVTAGSALGRMGFTGAGLNRTRAHLHLELTLLMNAHYEEWNKRNGGGINYQGLFNGMNLEGAEVSRFFIEQQKNPELQFREFVLATPVQFKVLVPAAPTQPDFLLRYPWLLNGSAEGAVSWEISFSGTGLPLGFAASQRQVAAPLVSQIRPAQVPQRYLTRGLVTGEGAQAALTSAGKKLLALLMDELPVAVVPVQAAKKKKPKPGA
ncbi:MAG: M23 family metallopeptidase [Verrucomicrobia bacterium]|nr:MAG: M23 family metallopeptidase [Verrucomicrobiota bacterium]